MRVAQRKTITIIRVKKKKQKTMKTDFKTKLKYFPKVSQKICRFGLKTKFHKRN